jgi:hypothetical protein
LGKPLGINGRFLSNLTIDIATVAFEEIDSNDKVLESFLSASIRCTSSALLSGVHTSTHQDPDFKLYKDVVSCDSVQQQVSVPYKCVQGRLEFTCLELTKSKSL